ncbi:MAG: carboxymuconolactone decarboxylase family protein [Caldilineaceae bacterium]
MSRLPNILPQDFTPEQQQLFAAITGGKRGQQSSVDTFLNPEGGLRGPFNALLYSPVPGNAVQRVGEALRFEGTLSAQLRELAILTVAANWQANYEWWAHEKIARQVGLPSAIIAGVKAGALPADAPADQALVYRFAREVIDQHHVSDACYAETVALLGEPAVVELVLLLGYYTLISMTLNVFAVPVPAGAETPFRP